MCGSSHAPPPDDLAHIPGVCPDWESNQSPFGLQAGTQSTEPHQPGLHLIVLLIKVISFILASSQYFLFVVVFL